jgi:uncharacterized protein (DUF433 family)
MAAEWKALMAKQNVIHSDPEILGGVSVFVGTRVPVGTLFEYLEAGDSLKTFLDQYPSVTRRQAIAALELAKDSVLSGARPS